MRKSVFILQQEADCDAYLKSRSMYPGEHVLISVFPDVCWELEKRDLPYKSIEDYSDFDELHRQGEENYQRLEKICSEIDPYLRQQYPILRQADFMPLMDDFFRIKMLYDVILFRICMVQSIVKIEKPDLLIIFTPESLKTPKWEPHTVAFKRTDNVFEMVLSLNGWNCPISKILTQHNTVVKIPRKTRRELIHSIRKISAINQHPFLFIPLFSLKNFGLLKTIKMVFYQYRNALKKNRTLFFLRQEPSWSSLLFFLYQHGYQVIYLPHENAENLTHVTLSPEDEMIISDSIKQYAWYQSIDFSGIIVKILIQLIEEYLTLLPVLLADTENRIFQYHPGAFVGSEKASPVEHILSHIAHKHHIPVISWQHGDGPFFPPMQMYVELMNSDIHMSYGPGHQKMLTDAQKQSPFCRVESVGSYSLEKILKNSSRFTNSGKILYVTAGYYYNNIYQNVHPPNDNEVWRHQKKILTVLGDSHRQVLLKLDPGPHKPVFFEEYISRKKYSNITTIWNEQTFSDLLPNCDIVICDIASTPVIEAIAAKKIIFVLMSDEKYLRKESLDLLKKRVYWSTSIDEFTKMIDDYLEGRSLQQTPDINNVEYLERFGVHKLDGKVSERVLSLLESLKTVKNQ